MTEHEQYQLAFSVLQSTSTPAQVLQRAEQTKGVFHMKKRWIPILVGAILVLLVGTATAAELQTHWLSQLLHNAEAHPEMETSIENPSVSNTVDGTTYTIDHLLVEGRTVFWQLTKTRSDGAPVIPVEAGESPNLTLKDRTGLDLGLGFSVTIRRLDDGTDPTTCTMLYEANLSTPGLSGEDLAGMTLSLTQTRDGTPSAADLEAGVVQLDTLISLETVIQPYSLRKATVSGDIGLNVGRLSIELQGLGLWGEDFETAVKKLNADCALILRDGRELPVCFSIHVDMEMPGDTQWHIAALPEIIDPQDAVALRVGDAVYEIKDKE